MTEDHESTNGAHGGVGHLLRMAKTQCGVSLAFAALRKADGGFAIATFPTLTADPTWSVEAIDELVRQTWDDPHLAGGSVLVRSGRVLKGMWTGQGHHIKLAAAALSDPEAPDHPWGLLCVAEPLSGHFEQDQLNLLGNLATRLTSYLRARQQVLEGSLTFGQSDSVVAPVGEPPSEAYEPMVETPLVPGPLSAQPSTPAPIFGEPDEPSPFEDLFGEFDDEHPLDRAANAFEPSSADWEEAQPRASRVDDWEFLGLDEIEWVEAVQPGPAPATPPTSFELPPDPVAPLPVEPAPIPFEGPNSAFGTREDAPITVRAATGSEELDAMLGPDPVTGLATLTTLVGRLSASLAHVRNNEGTVGLILVDVAAVAGPQLSTTALLTVAGRLTNHLRDRDMVARIGPTLFAILVDLRPGSIELETIRERSVGALTEGIEATSGGLEARSSMASASAGSTVTAEDLLREAADQLLGR
jgi:GGDEF domain-containing protein